MPFLFVSGTSFQSMYYGATARKIRAYFKALRKAARAEGGAIGFIEEIDAIAMARGGVSRRPRPTPAHRSRAARLAAAASTGLPASPAARPRPCRSRRRSPARASAASSTSCSCRCSRSTSRPAGRVSAGLVDAAQPAAARRTGSCRRPPAEPAERPADRRDQPRRQPRPGAAAARAASTAGSPSSCPDKAGRRAAHRPLPRPQGARRRAGRRPSAGTPSPAITQRLHAGDDRAPARRGARQCAAPRRAADDLGGRRAGPPGRPRSASASRSRTPTHEERLIATHEAGHATVAWLVGARSAGSRC